MNLRSFPRRLTFTALLSALAYPLLGTTATVNLDTTHQTIEGFGSSGVTKSLFDDEDFMDFVAYDLGFSMYRTEIRGMVSHPVENADDVRWEDFDLRTDAGADGEYVLNSIAFTKGIQFRRPDARLIGTVWSPPAWMKDNNSATGTRSGTINSDPDNHLSDDKYDHFARFLLEYVEMFGEEGVPFYGLSPANELWFTQTFQSCLWTSTEYARIIRTLGQAFAAQGVDKPLFFGPEDMTWANYSSARHKSYVDALMAPEVAKFFDVFATHGYTDGVQAGSTMDPALYWESIKQFDRPYWITEGGTGGHDWPEPIESGISAYLHYALAEGNVSAFEAWQIDGLNPDEHSIMAGGQPTKKTYAAMHYFRFIRPGFVRVEGSLSDGEASGIRLSAFRDEARERLVVVAINPGSTQQQLDLSLLGETAATQFQVYQTTALFDFEDLGSVNLAGESPSVSLPAKSITTLATLVPMSGITIGPDVMQLDIGAQGQLVKSVTPVSATDPRIHFKSSDEAVATVNGSGVVTAHAEGDATITATADDGGAQASMQVQVRFLDWAGWPVESGAYVNTGDAFIGWIYAHKDNGWIYSFARAAWIYLPEKAIRSEIAWVYLLNPVETSSEIAEASRAESVWTSSTAIESAAAVTNVLLDQMITTSSNSPGSESGFLVDGSYGSNGSYRWVTQEYPQWARIDLKGLYHFTEFRLYPWENRGYLYKIEVSDDDENYQIVVDRTARNASASVHINTVDATGRYVLLTVVGGGSYTGPWINLHELQGLGSLIVTPVTGIRMSPLKLSRGVGQTYQLQASLEPAIATNKNVIWSSSNTAAVAVNQSGLIEAVGTGEAAITVTSEDGGYTASTEVTIGDSAMWSAWPMSTDGLVDTGAFAGPIFVHSPLGWVYLYDLGRWAYLPETSVRTPGSWAALAF